MAPNFYLTENVDWIDPDGKLTKDQWMTVHLVFLNFLESVINRPNPEFKRPDLLSYFDKAKALIKSYINKASQAQLDKKLESANESLHELYDNVYHVDSESSEVVKCVFFRLLGLVAKDARKRIKGATTYKKYFDDVRIDEEGRVRSLKALEMGQENLGKIKDVTGTEFKDVVGKGTSSPAGRTKFFLEEDDEQWEDTDEWEEEDEEWDEDDDDEMDPSERLMAYYEDIVSDDADMLGELSLEVALAFHVVILKLCSICLDKKLYSKYQRNVIKAVTSYKDGQNPRQQEFNLRNANEAYVKLTEKLLDVIEEEYDDDSDESLNKDKFLIANNHGIMFISNDMDKEGARNLLNGITLNSDNIYISDLVDASADSFYIIGKVLYEAMVDALTAGEDVVEQVKESLFEDEEEYEDEEDDVEEDDVEEDDVEEDDVESLFSRYKKMLTEVLADLDNERAAAAHMMIPDILLMRLPKKFSAKYCKASNAYVSAYVAREGVMKIYEARQKADEALLSLQDSFKDITVNWDEKKKKNSLFEYLTTNLAVYYCLKGLRDAKPQTVRNVLEKLIFDEFDKRYGSSKALVLSIQYMNKAIKEVKPLWQKES